MKIVLAIDTFRMINEGERYASFLIAQLYGM